MASENTPRDQADSKAAAEAPETPADIVTMKVVHERPEFVRSEYPNHVTVFRSGVAGSTEEVTITFWQVSALGIDREQGTAKATHLRSYVMPREFAENVLAALAGNLGYTVSKGGDYNGD